MKEIVTIIREIISSIENWELKLSALENSILNSVRISQNQTIKQILEHLIDSTSINTQRVTHLQYQKSTFEFPNYIAFANNDR